MTERAEANSSGSYLHETESTAHSTAFQETQHARSNQSVLEWDDGHGHRHEGTQSQSVEETVQPDLRSAFDGPSPPAPSLSTPASIPVGASASWSRQSDARQTLEAYLRDGSRSYRPPIDAFQNSAFGFTERTATNYSLPQPANKIHYTEFDHQYPYPTSISLSQSSMASTQPPDPVYQCIFFFLDCNTSFGKESDWRIHTLSHFRTHVPPRSISCPFCETAFEDPENGFNAWEKLMSHVRDHMRIGESLPASFSIHQSQLVHYLWQKRVIDEKKLFDLRAASGYGVVDPFLLYNTSHRTSGRHFAERRAQVPHCSSRASTAGTEANPPKKSIKLVQGGTTYDTPRPSTYYLGDREWRRNFSFPSSPQDEGVHGRPPAKSSISPPTNPHGRDNLVDEAPLETRQAKGKQRATEAISDVWDATNPDRGISPARETILHHVEPDERDDKMTECADRPLDDQLSEVMSLITSVFSEASITTAASGITRSTGYSMEQITTATQELVLILYEDEILNPLYKKAIESNAIGPRRFSRQFRRLLRRYSKNLKEEVRDNLEYLAACLVGVKARAVADFILAKYQVPKEGSKTATAIIETLSENGSSTEDENATKDPIFADLIVVRQFLTGSNALLVLRDEFYGFVLPTKFPAKIHRRMPQWKASSVSACIKKGIATYKWWFRSVLLELCLIEPPCKPKWQRIRFTCNCGEEFFDDYREIQGGGLKKLKTHFGGTSGLHVVLAPDERDNSHQGGSFLEILMILRNLFRPLKRIFSKSQHSTLPQHQSTRTGTAQTSTNASPAVRTLHLMSCVQWGKYGRRLHQDMLEGIQSDRQLFLFLRERIKQHRGRMRSLLSMRAVKGILFVKFRLDMGRSVDVRDHDSVCHNYVCECLPPEARVKPPSTAEYLCEPIPPQTFPPIGPHHLMHYLSSPLCIDEQQTWVLDQFPKRTRGPLSGNPRSPAEGWGIFYQEGWDGEKLSSVLLIVFFFGSLLFGVLWSVLEMDIQGAFGVSSWWLSASGIFLAFLASRTDRL